MEKDTQHLFNKNSGRNGLGKDQKVCVLLISYLGCQLMSIFRDIGIITVRTLRTSVEKHICSVLFHFRVDL